MQATLPAKSLRSYLPRGQTLPADAFARRHRWMWRLLLTSSAVLVHLWHGAIEAHFHFFVMIPLLALYEDWIPFLLAVGYVAVHHGLMGAIDPGSVYNHADAIKHPWKWAGIHGLFVAAAGGVSIVSWRLNEEMREQTRGESRRRAEAEAVAATLQSGLRPDRLPDLTEGAVAARYLPAESRAIGGDWYDVVALPDSRVALTLGDVAGHGVHAASQMAALRHAVRAYAHEGFSPAQVARRVDRYFQGEFATFLYLVFDAVESELHFANAGHLPPLMIAPDGEARFLSQSLSMPLGLEQDAPFDERILDFPPGSVVLAYTDGLVERRTERIDVQLERLRAAVAGPVSDPREACERALAAFPPDGSDDVAVLAFQAARVRDETFEVPADPTELAGARARLRRWLADVGVDERVAYDLVLAADEALTNAIVHSGSARPAQVELAWVDGAVRITVRDFGRWDADANRPDHGRGLLLVDALTDSAEVTRGELGTTVTLTRRLPERAVAEPVLGGREPAAQLG